MGILFSNHFHQQLFPTPVCSKVTGRSVKGEKFSTRWVFSITSDELISVVMGGRKFVYGIDMCTYLHG